MASFSDSDVIWPELHLAFQNLAVWNLNYHYPTIDQKNTLCHLLILIPPNIDQLILFLHF